MTNHIGDIIRGVITLALITTAAGYVVVRSIRKADDPARMIFKWLVTAGVIVFMIWVAMPEVAKDDLSLIHI